MPGWALGTVLMSAPLCVSPPALVRSDDGQGAQQLEVAQELEGSQHGADSEATRAPEPVVMRPGTSSTEGPELPAPPEPDEPVARENWRMVVAGDVLVGVGMGGFGLMVAGLAVRARGLEAVDRLALREEPSASARADAEARVKLGNQLALGGGVATAVLIGTGVTLIAVGNRRERKRRARPREPRVGAWGGARSAGLTLSGEF